jgi:hypothetical protein
LDLCFDLLVQLTVVHGCGGYDVAESEL